MNAPGAPPAHAWHALDADVMLDVVAYALIGALFRKRWPLGGLLQGITSQREAVHTAPTNALFSTVPIPPADPPRMGAAQRRASGRGSCASGAAPIQSTADQHPGPSAHAGTWRAQWPHRAFRKESRCSSTRSCWIARMRRRCSAR